ncbi:uncharacterized protein ND-B17 [Prorops nasuta]|uniref:uncharacterized protein ND-B17 n=1 Tax=Prorops nasuta TaxID=863751 RepID=UPI0034CDCFEA
MGADSSKELTTKQDGPKWVSSSSGGVEPRGIEGRVAHQRERSFYMTDLDRAWRKKWLQDQILDPDEPKVPENYYKLRYNIIRRFYKYPMNQFETALSKVMSADAAKGVRYCTSSAIGTIFAAYAILYYYKYNKRTWDNNGVGWAITISPTRMFPDDPNYPNVKPVKQYATFGFENSPI